MLRYEHRRTELIVERLRDVEGIIRFGTLATSIAAFAAIGAFLGTGTRSFEGILVLGAGGVMVGIVVGTYSMIVFSTIIEWMCQILIAQGEVVESSRRVEIGSER
jgi:hypothetical protein